MAVESLSTDSQAETFRVSRLEQPHTFPGKEVVVYTTTMADTLSDKTPKPAPKGRQPQPYISVWDKTTKRETPPSPQMGGGINWDTIGYAGQGEDSDDAVIERMTGSQIAAEKAVAQAVADKQKQLEADKQAAKAEKDEAKKQRIRDQLKVIEGSRPQFNSPATLKQEPSVVDGAAS